MKAALSSNARLLIHRRLTTDRRRALALRSPALDRLCQEVVYPFQFIVGELDDIGPERLRAVAGAGPAQGLVQARGPGRPLRI